MATELTTITTKLPLVTRRLIELAAEEAGVSLSRYTRNAVRDLAVRQLTGTEEAEE